MSERVKHTPGPWTAKMSKYRDGVLVVTAGMPSNRVLADFGSPDEPLDEMDHANARLIAAAPELLDAAKFVMSVGIINPTGSKAVEEGIRRLNAAIAKPEG